MMENNCVNGLFTEDQESILTQIIDCFATNI